MEILGKYRKIGNYRKYSLLEFQKYEKDFLRRKKQRNKRKRNEKQKKNRGATF